MAGTRRTRPSPGAILLALAWLLALPGGVASGQEPGIRVVELFHPETGTRVRRVVADLTPGEISSIQAALADAGQRSGDDAGVLGSGTRSALDRFQRERGLAACGCPSYETILSLGLRPRVSQTVVVSHAPPDEPEPFRPTVGTEVLYGHPAPGPSTDGRSRRPPEPTEPQPAAAPSPGEAHRDVWTSGFRPLIPGVPDTAFGPLPPEELRERHPGLRATRVPMPGTRVPMPPIRPPIRSDGGG